MLKYRILTACALIPLVLAGIFLLPTLYFKLITAAIFLIAGFEWGTLCFKRTSIVMGFCLTLLLMMGLFHQYGAPWLKELLIISMVLWLLPLVAVWFYQPDRKPLFTNISLRAAAGIIFLLSAWAGLCQIQSMTSGGFLLISLFVLIWMADTAAYFAGRKWGKHKLSLVSPGKTLEGSMGGILGSLFAGVVVYFIWQCYAPYLRPILLNPLPLWLSFVLLISVLSMLGDLFESLLKRICGVKDSGKLLPGHGGLLDRIDSLLPTLPLFALFIL